MLLLRGRILSSGFIALPACTFYCILGKAERGFHVTLINFLPFAPVSPPAPLPAEALKYQPGPGTQFLSQEGNAT